MPVLRHKGKAAIRVVAEGVSGHSSRPDLGANAIHALLPALQAVAAEAEAQRLGGPRDANFEPPYSTLQIGTIRGGEALNIIPSQCSAEIEARAIAGVDPLMLLQPALEAVAACEGLSAEVTATYPPLALSEDHPLAALAAMLSGNAPCPAVSYGTEAGLFEAAGVPSIVCGPGDIARAHTAGRVHHAGRAERRARDGPAARAAPFARAGREISPFPLQADRGVA